MKLLLCQFVFLICTFGKKSCFIPDCGFQEYFSEDIPGCVNCPVNCDDQYSRDIERCRKACERKTKDIPTLLITTKVPENDEPTPQLATAETVETSQSLRKTTVHLKFKNYETTAPRNVGLGVCLGILGIYVVCLIAPVAYVIWRCNSKAPNGNSRDVGTQVETGDQPSTSSQKSSTAAVTTCSQCGCICPPLQEIGDRYIPVARDERVSSLDLE